MTTFATGQIKDYLKKVSEALITYLKDNRWQVDK